MIDISHFIRFKKKATGHPQHFAVAIPQGKRSIFNMDAGMLHVVGFWTDEKPVDKIKEADIIEVWIPLENVDYVESLVYRQRG